MNLMVKRGWKSLPEQARRQMEAYKIDKKWTLVYQDKLAEFKHEEKKRNVNRNTYVGNPDILARAEEEGSPEWYVKKVMDNSISVKQMSSLEISLRTQPIAWVKGFVDAQGQVALTNVLAKINRRKGQGPAPPPSAMLSRSENDTEREYEIIKCLKALMNNKYHPGSLWIFDFVPLEYQETCVRCVDILVPLRRRRRPREGPPVPRQFEGPVWGEWTLRRLDANG